MGMINKGIGTNGNPAMPNRLVSTPSPFFTSAPNQPFPLQNNMSHIGPGVFFPQNFNPVAMNQMNYSHQPNGQFFAQNPVNPFAYFNQNVCLPNGQFCLPSPVQGMNHFAQMQMPNFVVPNNVPVFQCQVSHGMGPQNPNFVANQQLGMLQANGAMQHGNQGLILPAMNSTPNPSQQLQGKSPLLNGFGSVQSQQSQNFSPQVFTKSQVTNDVIYIIAHWLGDFAVSCFTENSGKDNGANNTSNSWKNRQNSNFSRTDPSRKGYMKSQLHPSQNANRKFGAQHENGGKGYKRDRGRKSNSTNQIPVLKKSSLSLNYTEQEIQLWLEERKRNYPSKTNMEKKVAQKMTEPDGTEKDAKLRRQQLKEILAKQAELGCEVAEIPSQYLSDPEKQVHGREENRWTFNKKGRFQNKFNKRGRLYQNDRFTKKQRSAAHDSSTVTDQNDDSMKTDGPVNNNRSIKPAMNQREPTLLQKLLSADIRRDKSRLLQVFRFMVMNSFFEDWPEKPLRFPLVTVKENEVDGKGELVEDGYSQVKKGVFRGSETTAIKKSYEDGEEANKICELERNEGDIRTEMEEEGEIID
ncbi:hypothetical protein RJ639_019164 [Escallonia herrerae]|uniref:FMR1-interacting protein 1 conserved domain-containing protein n=1 Tax=Escallonia herrerae TaxID=1293975 RepID=A0AA88V8S9_9ASTE|nr:hypothetical protein RJ639_019164 [Escallonia herrerae]